MRAVIFANGALNHHPNLAAEDLVIAADGGGRHCLALGVQPAIVIGDLDSLNPDEQALLRAGGAEIRRYPERKDFTDLELALLAAREAGAGEILILGALGLRWDQTLANLLLAASQPGVRVRLEDGSQEFHFIKAGEPLELAGQPGDVVSLVPLAGPAAEITTGELEYPLKDECLEFGSSRGVSNRMLGERATITIGSGLLACVHTRQAARP